MKKWDLSSRIILISLAPTLLVALLLLLFFNTSFSSNIDNSLQKRAVTIASNLALTSEFDIVSQNFINLANHGAKAQENNSDLEAVVFFNNNHRIISSTGPIEIVDKIPTFTFGEVDNPSISAIETKNTSFKQFLDGYIYFHLIRPSFQDLNSDYYAATNSQLQSEDFIGYVAIYVSMEQSNSIKRNIFIVATIICLLGMILSVFLASRLASGVVKPIQSMITAAKKIKEGFLNTRIKTYSKSELLSLEQGFNSMAEKLEHNQEELKAAVNQATSDLQDTLETLEVNNLELDLARKQALEASRVKTEFLANMGHEIRTPMNGVIGFTELLLKTELNNKQKDFLLDIKRSASNLLSIIDDILDYSKIEAGKMSLERYPFDLRECVDDVFSMLGQNANKKGVELVSLVYSDIPDSLLGDPIRIKQIITNLISNSIKFTNAGSIELHAEIESELDSELTLKIKVKDTGIGLSKDQQNSLFKAFNQADASTKRIFGGTGLGLVISKSLVEKMGGEIFVESNEGEGATFWFTLKCLRSESSKETKFNSQILAHNSALVFDPHPSTRLSMVQMLENLGMPVKSFDTVEDLTTELELHYENKKNLDIVIVGGQTFKRRQTQLEYICSMASNIDCPVITFSTSPDATALDKLQELGVNRTLRKPVTHRNMYNVLLETLRDKNIDIDGNNDFDITQLSDLYVLAVDDNAANLRLVSILLSDLGLNVDIAENGIEAISLSKDKVYDLILMDIQMPEIDGLEATRTIKANNTNSRTPIVALTAHAMANEKEQLLEAGMADYMTKPVSESDLVRMLFKWTQNSVVNTEILEENNKGSEETLDWDLSIKLANGNTSLAIDMLKMLVDSNYETSKNIHAAYQAQEFENLLHQVHKLHGASCYLGTPRLKRLSSNYETKLKKQQFNSIEQIHNDLLAELEKINDEAKPYIAEMVS